MSISVDFAPEVENRVYHEANRLGFAPDAYIRKVVEQSLPALEPQSNMPDARDDRPAHLNAPTIALLEQWRKADEEAWLKMTPEEREQEEADMEVFKEGMNENRRLSGDYRLLYP